MEKDKWVLCPICNNKTRIKVRHDTVLENFPLYCPKCKQETIISIKCHDEQVITLEIRENDKTLITENNNRKQVLL